MNRTMTLNLTRTNLITLGLLLGVASIAPIIGNQYVTGTIVNATLLITVALLGVAEGLLVAIIPSSIALATGLLPAMLAPMVPFIILGNALMVLVFGQLKNRNYWLGAITGAVIKFAFLAAMIVIVTKLILNSSVAARVAYMMSWPQLVTALAGGVLAYGVLRVMRKTL